MKPNVPITLIGFLASNLTPAKSNERSNQPLGGSTGPCCNFGKFHFGVFISHSFYKNYISF